MDVSVVLPTYNEASNLPVIVPRICEVIEQAGLVGEVIVVDDDSPDGSAAVARRLAQELAVRVLVRRQERGLATAALAGFALSEAAVVVVMDADGSHPVDKLPSLIRPILDDQADIAVGSRWLAGGAVDDWPLRRRLVSKTARLMALGLSPLSDPTTGFMAVRRALLSSLEVDPVGWKIVLEVVVKADRSRLVEIPITFCDRQLGESKLGLSAQLAYLRHLARLHQHRRPSLGEFVKFCLVGSLGVLVDLLTVILLREVLQLDHRLCGAGGFLAAVTHNYLLNRYFTFETGRAAPFFGSYLVFVAVCSVGLVVRLAVLHGLVEHTALGVGRWYILANFIGIVVATAVNFTGSKFFAFSADRLAFGTGKNDDESESA